MNDKHAAIDWSVPPTSFSAFKPVGHVVVGFPDDASCARAVQALAAKGAAGVQQIACADMRSRMAQMLDLASGSAEFGHEIVEMRRFLALSADGYGWLVAAASDDAAARQVVAIVEPLGARVAVHYGRLVITDVL